MIWMRSDICRTLMIECLSIGYCFIYFSKCFIRLSLNFLWNVHEIFVLIYIKCLKAITRKMCCWFPFFVLFSSISNEKYNTDLDQSKSIFKYERSILLGCCSRHHLCVSLWTISLEISPSPLTMVTVETAIRGTYWSTWWFVQNANLLKKPPHNLGTQR